MRYMISTVLDNILGLLVCQNCELRMSSIFFKYMCFYVFFESAFLFGHER